jgi:hypothetical protein
MPDLLSGRIIRQWDFLTQDILDQVFPEGFPGFALEHAAVMETSLMAHYHPQLVRLELIPMCPTVMWPSWAFPLMQEPVFGQELALAPRQFARRHDICGPITIRPTTTPRDYIPCRRYHHLLN